MEAVLAIAACCLLAPISLGIAALVNLKGKVKKPTTQEEQQVRPKRGWLAILPGWRER